MELAFKFNFAQDHLIFVVNWRKRWSENEVWVRKKWDSSYMAAHLHFCYEKKKKKKKKEENKRVFHGETISRREK